jgi:SAM-dependent methyltransferase
MSKDFYASVVESMPIDKSDEILVVCGGPYDARTWDSNGFKNVVISNVDHHDGVKDLDPFSWSYQDAEALTLADKSVDWTAVNGGLHHCASPHRALCEMLRVSRKGVIVLESRDNLLMRTAIRFGLGVEYETEPALLSGGALGGYRNTPIPNYVYRWNEREFEKAVLSYMPQTEINFKYHYGYTLPRQRLMMSANPIVRSLVVPVDVVAKGFETFFPKQGNSFAMIASFTPTLKPWLRAREDGELEVDLDYLAQKYDKSRYVKE